MGQNRGDETVKSNPARMVMDPAGARLRYVDAQSRESCTEELASFASIEGEEVDIEATFDGEVVELAVTPKQPILVEFAQVKLRHAASSDELVLLNGYQSWTDTAERPAWSRMRGLAGVPSKVVDHFTLDGSGDYGIVDYSPRRGRQHGFTYATFRRNQSMVLVGSLNEDNGFTFIRFDAAKGELLLETECPIRVLEPGQRVVLGRYAIVQGAEDDCYDRWFELSDWKARAVRPVIGYTSWYRHYGDIDSGKLLSDLKGASDVFSSIVDEALGQNPEVESVFQIDDGFCKVGDWLELDREKFPEGLKPIAQKARDLGFLPGLWVAPFVCEKESRVFSEKPDWLLRDAEGNPVPTGCHWSGGYALDTRNVEVRSHVLNTLQTMTREWGFRLIKADFLYAACMVERDGMNRGELMADALDLLRTGAGDETLILGCGVPLGSAFGRVDYCRIGCDVSLNWNGPVYMWPLHRERESTRNSLANTIARRPLDGRAFGNDPDVFFLRDDVRISRARRDELLESDAQSGTVLLTSDDMGAWSEQDRERYRAAIRTLVDRKRRGA